MVTINQYANMPDKSSLPPPNFEAAIAELEAIVHQMESGNLPLEQSLKSYQRSAELLQFCQKSLAAVEQQVQILADNNKLSTFTQNNE
ncbi:MAG: exodeoxyribonuclease VII small subunit [Methylophilaceae bacterium]